MLQTHRKSPAGVRQLAIAVRQVYGGGGRESRDFDQVVTFFETLLPDRLTFVARRRHSDQILRV
jgi:hypothetical protein